jgi:Tol biopolymer transport system component
MIRSRHPISDALIRDALASRADIAGTGSQLVADVLTKVDALPQRRPWTAPFGGRLRLIWIVVTIGLVLAALAGGALFGGHAVEPPAADNLIAYVSASYSWEPTLHADGHGLYTIPVAGGQPSLLARIPGETVPESATPARVLHVGPAIRWSPDGTRMAFRLSNNRPGLYVVNSDGSDLRLVAEATASTGFQGTIGSFAWSPDGTRIAFISPAMRAWPHDLPRNGSLHVVDLETGAVQEINGLANGSVAWSPDGSRIAFGRSETPTSALVVMNADGTGERAFHYHYLNRNHIGPIAWSPDGSRIAFRQTRFPGPGSGEYVMIVNGDGTQPREVAHWMAGCCYHGAFGGLLEWSPDGTLIATPAVTGDGERVWVIAADGSGIRSSISGYWFDWSPDGSRLVVSAPGAEAGRLGYRAPAVYTVDVDGSDRRWLAAGDYPEWSP